MYRYAEKAFQLDKKPKGSESSLRSHLEAIEAQTGITPDELVNPPPNFAVGYLLDYFYQLNLSRQCGMVLNPLLYSEIEAWQRLYRIELDIWEIDTIKRLDYLFLSQQSED